MWDGKEFSAAEIPGFDLAADTLRRLFDENKWTDCVIENYIVTTKTVRLTRQDTALRLIGVVENLCHEHGVRFTKHNPGKRNRCSNAQLHRIGAYQKTKDDHANDALKHLVVYGVAWHLFDDALIRRLLGK